MAPEVVDVERLRRQARKGIAGRARTGRAGDACLALARAASCRANITAVHGRLGDVVGTIFRARPGWIRDDDAAVRTGVGALTHVRQDESTVLRAGPALQLAFRRLPTYQSVGAEGKR